MSQGHFPSFFTWSPQSTASFFELDRTSAFHYHLPDKTLLDMTSTSYHLNFGLRPDFIFERVQSTFSRIPLCSPKGVFPLKKRASEKLIHYLNKSADKGKIFYTVSGAEAIENAVKMARVMTGKMTVAATQDSYHGASLGALSLTGDWRNKAAPTLDQWTLRIPGPLEDPSGKQVRKTIERYGPDQIGAICLETITGHNGALGSSETRWQEIQDICDEYSIQLILDEVICGLGRTGHPFGFHRYPFLRPDYICMAKGITGGVLPFGAIWCSSTVSQFFNENLLPCGLTQYAYPLGLSAMEAVIDELQKVSFQRHMNELKVLLKNFFSFLRSTFPQLVTETRQFGLLGAIILSKKAPLFEDFHQYGLHLLSSENRIMLAPPLNIPKDFLEEGHKKITKCLEDIS